MFRLSRLIQLCCCLVAMSVFLSCVSTTERDNALVVEALATGGDYAFEGLYVQAAEEYVQAIRKVPRDARLLYNLSMVQAQAGDFQKALETGTRLNSLFPDNVRYLGLQAGLLFSSGDRFTAFAVWERILELNPYDQVVRMNLANAYFEDGDFNRSAVHARILYRQKQFSVELFTLLGRLQAAMGEGDGSSWYLLADSLEEKAVSE
jgi:predicted Zn-dependent protease